MKVQIKGGVSLLGMTPQMAIAWPIIMEVWREEFWPIAGNQENKRPPGAQYPLVMTSGTDDAKGRKPKSKHKSGNAIDLRRKDPMGVWAMEDHEAESFATRLRMALGGDFDVVVTAKNAHIEYDPR